MQLEPQLVTKTINQVTRSVLKCPTWTKNTFVFRLHVLDSDSSAQFSVGPVWIGGGCGGGCGAVWRAVSFFSLTRAPFFKRFNLPLSVSKPTVICPQYLWEVRWLPRLSQPVQCKDRKSQGSTPHTPTSNPYNSNAASRARQIQHKQCWAFSFSSSMMTAVVMDNVSFSKRSIRCDIDENESNFLVQILFYIGFSWCFQK